MGYPWQPEAYQRNAWGRPVSVTEAQEGIDTDGILQKNPFRYRGYYYDNETGFYYLNARYYAPELRRFISADDQITGVGESVIGYNLFAYCNNNPVGFADYDGHMSSRTKETLKNIAIGAGRNGAYREAKRKNNIPTQNRGPHFNDPSGNHFDY